MNRENRMPVAALQTYSLQLIGPIPVTQRLKSEAGVRTSLAHFLVETEENLTELLPEFYSVRIKEWDE